MLITGAVGPAILAALSFSLAMLPASSLIFLWYSSRRIHVSVEPKKLKVFKHENASTVITLISDAPRWLRPVSLSLENTPGLEGRATELGSPSFEFTVKPSYAGMFELSTARFGSEDVLGLFVRQETLPIHLIVESLPLALLAPPRLTDFLPLAVGENPAGRKGFGQEFYGVGEYLPGIDTKDILWKRVAQAEDGSISVRVREANVKASVTLGIALGWNSEDERARMVDLALEAMAQIGRTLFSVGTTFEVVYPSGGALVSARASSTSELAVALLEVAGASAKPEFARGPVPACDLLLMSQSRGGGPQERAMAKLTPVLVLADQLITIGSSTDISLFTGREDLSRLTMMVMGR